MLHTTPSQNITTSDKRLQRKRRRKRFLPFFVLALSGLIALLIVRQEPSLALGQTSNSPPTDSPSRAVRIPQQTPKSDLEKAGEVTATTEPDSNLNEPEEEADILPLPLPDPEGAPSTQTDSTIIPLSTASPAHPPSLPDDETDLPDGFHESDGDPSQTGQDTSANDDSAGYDADDPSAPPDEDRDTGDAGGVLPIPLPIPRPLPVPLPIPLPLPIPTGAPDPAPPPLPAPVPPPAPVPHPAPGGDYYVQVHATPHEHSICEIWFTLKETFPDLFAHAEQSVSRLDQHDGSILFRLRVGAFDTAEDASAFCARLKRDGHDCFVAPPK